MIIYIASPYTKGDQAQNVRTSLLMAEKIRELGYLPYCPLLSHFWHFLFPHPYEYWMKQGLEWVERSDAVIRLPGESEGADREVELALSRGIPVFYSFQEFKDNAHERERMSQELEIGCKVRVKDGIKHADLTWCDLSGWTGKVVQIIDDRYSFVVRWNDATITNKMSNRFKLACVDIGLTYSEYGLFEYELERIPDDN